MPELPEVETIRVRLEPVVRGRRIVRAEIADARVTRPIAPATVAGALEGARVDGVSRRGKYLILELDHARRLLVHLRMTGSMRLRLDRRADTGHVRASLRLDDGGAVDYHDVRRFGTWLLTDDASAEEYLEERLGPEPLGPAFTTELLAAGLRGRHRAVKACLLDQRLVAGLGNIYVDEALWRARIAPVEQAGRLEAAQVAAVRRAIRAVLRKGIARRGATLRDYRDPAGRAGGMQDEFEVYGRDGEPCGRCGALVGKTRVGGRGTWFCPVCQERQ